MLERGSQIVVGVIVMVIGAVIAAGPIIFLQEQPKKPPLFVGGSLIVVGMWLAFPVGMGKFGDWVAENIPLFKKEQGNE